MEKDEEKNNALFLRIGEYPKDRIPESELRFPFPPMKFITRRIYGEGIWNENVIISYQFFAFHRFLIWTQIILGHLRCVT